MRSLREYIDVGSGFKKFYFAIGTTADMEESNGRNSQRMPNTQTNDVDENNEDVEENNFFDEDIRKFFKLGRARNFPRGAPGRLPTAYGSVASAADQYRLAVEAESNARRSIEQRNARNGARIAATNKERPLTNLLFSSRTDRKDYQKSAYGSCAVEQAAVPRIGDFERIVTTSDY